MKKPVFYYKDGKYAGFFDSAYDAESALKIQRPNLIRAIKKGWYCGGYKWSYVKADNYSEVFQIPDELKGDYISEFTKLRLEQTDNITQISRDINNKFNLDLDIDYIRNYVISFQNQQKITAKRKEIKRLFFDIETGYYILKIRTFQLKNSIKYFNPKDIIKEKQIICISYKWQGSEEVYTLDYRNGEKEMLKKFVKVMEEADEIISHNGDKFDIRELRTRCLFHGVLMYPTYRSLDTLKKSRQYFRFASNKLDYITRFLNIGDKLEHEGFDLWRKVVEDEDKEALNKMIEYCEQDVILLEDSYFVLSPFILNNNNFAVLTGGEKWECPECASSEVEMYRTYTTAMGIVRRNMKCNNCKKQYKISNRTYMKMLENFAKNQ